MNIYFLTVLDADSPRSESAGMVASGEDSLPGWQVAAILLCAHMAIACSLPHRIRSLISS